MEIPAQAAGSAVERPPIDFNKTPFVAIWEITRACPLACIHCRAQAQPHPHPDELTTEEGFGVIDQVAEAGVPLFVLTGGDPMQRSDVYDLVEYAVGKGVHTSFSPSATGRLTAKALARLKRIGLMRAALSLDGTTAETHDGFRGVKGSHEQTVEAMKRVRESGIGLQVQTTVSRHTVHELRQMADFVAEARALMWNVFFLVPTGRGQAEDMISAQQHEEVFHWLYDLSITAPFDVKTTAAPHYRRVVLQRRQAAGVAGSPFPGVRAVDGLERAAFEGVNDGKGFAFVSHLGEVCPSGFLQLPAGNVRQQRLMDVYRDSPLFRDLRNPCKIKGKCGRCDYREVCGGSRARAYAVTGDPLESEPLCVYEQSAP